MKISFIAPCLGALALLTVPSCSSTDRDGYAETAVSMSEMSIADGEIPPWLLEDDGSNGGHVDAGAYTPSASSARNNYSIPEPNEKPGSGTRQNQKRVATVDPSLDDTVVEPASAYSSEVDPLAASHPTASYSTPKTTKPKSTASTASTKSGKKTGSSASSSKPKKPTMIVYKVRPGDNLSVIAARSNTTVEQIRRDSKLTSETIYPGQVIKVRYTPKDYKPEKKDGKGKGSKDSSKKTHTVESGQSPSVIAAKYGVSTAALMKANNLTEESAKKLRPGQKLVIPEKSAKKDAKTTKSTGKKR